MSESNASQKKKVSANLDDPDSFSKDKFDEKAKKRGEYAIRKKYEKEIENETRRAEQLKEDEREDTVLTIKDVLLTSEASAVSVSDLARRFKVDTNFGLRWSEAQQRAKICGINELEVREVTPMWRKYLAQLKNPLILLLLGSAAVSAVMKNAKDAISITVAILIVITLGFVQEYRSEKSLEALKKLVPPECRALRSGELETFLARELVPGDVVHLNVGDRVPADLRLFAAIDLLIDESSFTGEAEPANKNTDVCTDISNVEDYTRMTNIAFMGTLVRSGHGKGIVVSTGERSTFGEIFRMMQLEEAPQTPLQKSMNHLGTQLSFLACFVTALIVLVGWVQDKTILDMFSIGVSLAVAAIPEGLPIVVAVTLAIGVMRMAKKNAIVRHLSTVETLGCVNVICSDKTGTLTKNEMTVTVIVTSDGFVADVTGAGYNDHGEVEIHENENQALAMQQLANILEIGAVCNNAYIQKDSLTGQPTEGALLAAAMKFGIYNPSDDFVRLQEIPFSSEQKFMAVKIKHKYRKEDEIYFAKGALEKLLPQCSQYQYGTYAYPLGDVERGNFARYAFEFSKRGLRIIALAKGKTMDNLMYCGFVGMADPPRPLVQEAIATLRKYSIRVKMVTGDAQETAMAIANLIGIATDRSRTLSGYEIDQMNENQLQHYAPKTSVFYRVTPRHKLTIVKALQANGFVVAMTGDGVNDGVALKKADIGIAMGKNGTDVCKEAADMILVDDDFHTIIVAIEEGKAIFANIRNFVRFQLTISVSALSLIGLTVFCGYKNPLSAVQILWINIIMDGPLAQSLAVEPVDTDVLELTPRNVKTPMINTFVVINVLVDSIIITSGTFYIFYERMADGDYGRTWTFTTFVFYSFFHALSCRSQSKSVFKIGLMRNKMFLIAGSFSLLGQLLVIYFMPLQSVFQTEPLPTKAFLEIIGITSTIFVFSEIKKLVLLAFKF